MKQHTLLASTFTIALGYFLLSCGDRNMILDKQDFDNGKWLLIDRNRITDSVRGITDNQILKKYSKRLIVKFDEDDKGTTCDGVIELYKNGKLVNSQEYLSDSRVSQPVDLEKLYYPCKLLFIETATVDIQNTTFDSLNKRNDTYPIINLNRPDDTHSVLYCKFGDPKNVR